jgi:hypothetical protein
MRPWHSSEFSPEAWQIKPSASLTIFATSLVLGSFSSPLYLWATVPHLIDDRMWQSAVKKLVHLKNRNVLVEENSVRTKKLNDGLWKENSVQLEAIKRILVLGI